MDLILWRHAEASDAGSALAGSQTDLGRQLTERGERQARRMAQWLDRQLVDTTKIYTSPAVRAERTAHALGRKYKITDELAPLATPQQLLSLAQWPDCKNSIALIGHQPTLGMTIAALLNLSDEQCSVRKGAVWWLRCKQRDGVLQTHLMAVQAPDFL